jgi:CHAT domain-containing protein
MISCSHRLDSPQVAFENADRAFVHRDLQQSKDEAREKYEELRGSAPYWALKFRILEAKAALWQGLFPDVLKLLKSVPQNGHLDIDIPTLTLLGVAHAHLQEYSDSERLLSSATGLCSPPENSACGDVLQARGLLASEHGDSASAEELFSRSLSFARSHHDSFLEATSLLNLGAESLAQSRFDEALDRSEAAYLTAKAMGARVVEPIAQGNIGWASYRLGDSDKALELFLAAEKRASELRDFVDQGVWLTNAGYVYMDAHDIPLAEQSFRHALTLEQQGDSRENIYNALRASARLALQMNELNEASDYAERALSIARTSRNHVDELFPLLVQGQAAARRDDGAKAKQIFEAVENDQMCPVFLKWEAQHSLARLYQDEKQLDTADREYRAALATFESARDTVRREDFQLSFLTNAAHIYDDYVHFLVAQGKSDEALRWADYNRARTLLEGLGLLSKGPSNASHAGPPPLHPREISRQAKGVLLFYWLGEKQSYLWAITPQKTSLFPLHPGADIEALVQRYRTALKGPQDVLESSEDGRALYRTLIAPAKSLLANNAKVFIIPDGSLNNLNFETLIVADPKPHYWIEDADVVNVSSLRVLEASLISKTARARIRDKKRARTLLLIGDSVAPSKEYPELPRAGQQMANVAKHFPAPQEQVYQRDRATPAAYLAGNPETFSHIHFVAHGTASRLSPLDSAIVLSKDAVETDSFKLYARDIVQHHLHADLVTISACYGAGERAYSGEGLVGLAWAFLRAGAHNVIAGLWEVTDESTEQLMDRFYDELDKGASPDVALRAAKLSLLHGSQFHDPFYWAPFQLYTGA